MTGAAGNGIGQGIARRLAAGGATVIVTDSHERRTKDVSEAIARDHDAATVAGYPMDVSDRTRVAEVLDEVARTYGPVQILVNNAAWNVLGDIFEYDFADWDRVIDVDLTGPFNTTRLALPGMREAGGGVIVNISSIGADLAAGSGETPYAVAKGGLNTLTRQIARVGGPHNIRCNAVALGLVTNTRFTDIRPHLIERVLPDIPLGRAGTAGDVVEAAAFLASDRASFITGEILNVSGGFYMRN
ncbi:SDR family NAD(P)-dependent oxidoreductase [Streptomyces sp. NPDC057690]|uniref:SDR family NAD(P)-dependent oxidoreductase n=1 Tax=Streptomyces sp. NPDC057690 TaxID=3346214 RepID=UPI003690575E